MKTVLYTPDMEPITVLDVTPQIQAYLETNERVALAVMEPINWLALADDPVEVATPRYVHIWRERFVRYGKSMFFLFTNNDENALLLQTTFLPGQTSAVRAKEQSAFARGFLTAWARLGE